MKKKVQVRSVVRDCAPTLEFNAAECAKVDRNQEPSCGDLHRSSLYELFGRECLQGLSPQAETALLERFSQTKFEQGDLLLEQGKFSSGLYVLSEGSVNIYLTQGNEQHRIGSSSTGEVLGEMSLLTARPCTANVVATEPTQAYRLSREDFVELQGLYPELEIALSQIVSDRLGSLEFDALCGKQLGDYVLHRCINRGGMGVVYEATHTIDGKPVALKMLRHQFVHDPNAIGEFLREGELLKGLNHENLVAVSDCFVALNTRFLVMDLWNGQDLHSVISRQTRLDDATTCSILGQVAAGLRYAHQCGVLHLDIKPSNILISENGCAALSDFGLSKLLGNDKKDSRLRGTPAYMPPEQFREGQIIQAADWYALSCTAVEMLTGHRLFREESIPGLLVAKQQFRPQVDLPPFDACPELRRLIVEGLAGDGRDRKMDLDRMIDWAKAVPGLI